MAASSGSVGSGRRGDGAYIKLTKWREKTSKVTVRKEGRLLLTSLPRPGISGRGLSPPTPITPEQQRGGGAAPGGREVQVICGPAGVCCSVSVATSTPTWCSDK
ncbi:hypothetical protein E2C01_044464 [Portunus trituberculatus]|uniref:Uncharacterized protein n=1 Tax=Portunus trituberculatus TaxID=210409 RepID=A0A5B7FZB5_PORTR|nr:hypothetical protein [Portunus trituberculatus]